MTANSRQVGGTHYSKYGDQQPWDMYKPWNLDGFQAQIISYVVRWRDKDGVKDLEKALHFLEKYIEVEKQAQEMVELSALEFNALTERLRGTSKRTNKRKSDDRGGSPRGKRGSKGSTLRRGKRLRAGQDAARGGDSAQRVLRHKRGKRAAAGK